VAVAIDVSEVGSEGWWMKRLFGELEQRRARAHLLDTYYRGENGIPVLATKATRDAYRRLMAMARTNFAELAVEAVRERMMPVGFRTGAEPDDLGDKEAWRIWQANALDADAALVHRSSLAMADGYVIVGDVDDDLGAPLITTEDPREVITAHDPRNRRRVRAGLKAYYDDEQGIEVAYVYVPGEVHRAVRERPKVAEGETPEPVSWQDSGWTWDGDVTVLPDPKMVPVVRFPNRADNFGRSLGEFEPHLPLLDRINFTILSRLEIATMQAFRQRAVKGDLPTHDDEGNEVDYDDIFANDPGALWMLPATAEMWESGVVDLGPIRSAVRDDVQDFAAVTRTPLFYLTPEANNGSAEGASLAREGLVFKTGDRVTQASDPWERVMSYAFLMAGDEDRAKRADMQVLWAPPERFSLSEKYDAASKAAAAGVPWRTVMSDVLQFDPQKIERMEGERATDALLAPPQLPAQAASGG
jgi:hypothetical protein